MPKNFMRASADRLTSRLIRLRGSTASDLSGKETIATVGDDMTGWPEEHGTVLAIYESTNEISIYTQRSVIKGDVINVGPEKVTAREYFDDFRPTS